MKLDIETIDLTLSDKNIKALAFALVIKDMYVSSSVKNYNPHSLQKKLKSRGFKFHHSTIVRYVNLLIKYELAYFKDGCLIVRRLHKNKPGRIRVEKGQAKIFKDYIHLIRAGLISRKIWQAKYVHRKKLLSTKLLQNPRSIKEFRKAKRLAATFGVLKPDEQEFYYRQSILSFCDMLNCSVREFYTTIRYLEGKKMLSVTRHSKWVSFFSGGEFDITGYFIWKGSLYKCAANSYSMDSPCP